MDNTPPRILLIGMELDKAQRDRLEELFDVVSIEESGQAIDLLLQGQHSGVVYEPGRVPSSDRARDLQIRVDDVDEMGGDLLDLDAERISPLNLAQRLHLLLWIRAQRLPLLLLRRTKRTEKVVGRSWTIRDT